VASWTVDTSVEPLAAIRDKVEPVLHYMRYHDKNYTLLYWLNQKARKAHDGGKFIVCPVMGTEADDYTEIKTGFEEIPTQKVDEQDAIRVQIGASVKPIITAKLHTDVYNRESPQRVYNYLLEKVKTASLNIKKNVAAALHSANSAAGEIHGLRYCCPVAGTQAYAGYTYATADVNQYDSSSTVLSPSKMHTMLMNCNAETEAIFTTKALYSAYWAIRQAHERYTPASGKGFASIGAPVLGFNDIPVVWDLQCPDYHMYFLTSGGAESKHMYFYVSPAWDFKMVKVADRTPQQEVEVARYLFAGQLVMPVRKYQGVFSALAR